MKYTTALFQTIAAPAFRLLSLPIESSAFVPAAARPSVASLHSSSNSSSIDGDGEPTKETSATELSQTTTTKKKKKKKKKKNPIDVFGIDHVVLLVDDLEGTTEWYRTVLGCTVAKRNEKFQMVHLDAGSALIDLVDRKGPLGNNNSSNNNDDDNNNNNGDRMGHLCLGLRDFDEPAIRAHLEEHGVSVTTDLGVRFGKGGYGESLYFRDPEGTEIEIRKSLVL